MEGVAEAEDEKERITKPRRKKVTDYQKYWEVIVFFILHCIVGMAMEVKAEIKVEAVGKVQGEHQE